MALKGDLKDFNITSILQVVSGEKKTGVLSIKKGDKFVSVSFAEGKVVNVERGKELDEVRVKNILIKNRLITENDWNVSYAEREKTLTPLFTILKRFVRNDALSVIINKQIKDGIFDLLKWQDGEYQFVSNSIVYDKEINTPLDANFLLMEGCRIVDETGEIKKKISKITKPIEKRDDISNNEICAKTTDRKKRVEIELGILKDKGVALTEDEKKVWAIIQNGMTVNDIVSASMLTEFDTYTVISNFFSDGIITQASRRLKQTGKRSQFAVNIFNVILLIFAVMLNFYGAYNLYLNIGKDWNLRKKMGLNIISYKIKDDLQNIVNAAIEYYGIYGIFPEDIKDLTEANLLIAKDIYDPFGKNYNYFIDKDSKIISVYLSKYSDIEEYTLMITY